MGRITDFGISPDMDNVPNGYGFLRYNADTLNSPLSEGLTNSGSGISISYRSVEYAVQFCISQSDKTPYIRRRHPTSGWEPWNKISLKSDLESSTAQVVLGQIRYCKVGNIVILTSHGNIPKIPAREWTTLFTMPSGYRPLFEINCAAAFDSSADKIGSIKVTTDGTVQAFCAQVQDKDSAWFSISFPIAE